MDKYLLLSKTLGGGIADWEYADELVTKLDIEDEFIVEIQNMLQYDALADGIDPIGCVYLIVLEYVTEKLNLSYHLINNIYVDKNYLGTDYDVDEETTVELRKLCKEYLENTLDVIIEWFNETLPF